jgi:hypothetical protein
MSATSFLGEVRESRRLLRLHHQLRRELSGPMSFRLRAAAWFFVWGIFPLLAFAPWHAGVWLPLLIVAGTVQAFLPMKLTSFEALRYPSRRALCVARLLWPLGWLLWVGIWWAVGLGWVARSSANPSWYTPPVAACAVLAPCVMAAGLWGVVFVAVGARNWAMLPICGFVFVIVVLWDPVLRHVLNQSPWLLPAGLGLVTVGLLLLEVWAVERIEPFFQIQLSGESPWLLTSTPPRPASTAAPGRLSPSPLLRGRHGLAWASLYVALVRMRLRWMEWVGSNVIWFILLGGILGSGMKGNEPFSLYAPGHFWVFAIILLLALAGPPALAPQHPQRLYLLGVDYRAQLLHRVRTFWIAPPLLLATLLMTLVAILTGRIAEPLSFLAMVFAMQTYRAGWLEWPSLEVGQIQMWALLLLPGLALLLLILFPPGWPFLFSWEWGPVPRALLFAGVTLGVGLTGIVWRLLRLDEAKLREVLHGIGAFPIAPARCG